jgi:hypothetical protein
LTGQLSQWNGERRFLGKLGRELGVDEGQRPRVAVSGDLDRVVRCVRVAGFVNSVPV